MSASTRLSFAVTALLLLSAAGVQAQTARCRPCETAQERCSVNCFGRGDKAEIGACLIGCDNAAAVCTCDQPATLSAEEALALGSKTGLKEGFKVATAFATACNSTTPCGAAYGACTNWSYFYDCGDPYCGTSRACAECDEWGRCEYSGPADKQDRERYRVCFDSLGNSCTEYQRSSSTGACGCF